MKNDPRELLSAFLDGETVDPSSVAEALSEPDALEALRDFVLLRAESRADAIVPRAAAYRELEAILAPPAARPWWRRMVPVPAPLLAASVIVAAALGIWIGFSTSSTPGATDLPPTPDRVIRFEPAPEPSAPSEASPDDGEEARS